jgi:hypothetical protein
VLDPAGYGTVNITKAISIVNDGVGTAGIRASSGNGVTINAGASDSVHLRGLTIEGLGTGLSGIQFNTGGNLAIENCVIRNFDIGIFIRPTTPSTFSVSDTIASNNIESGISVLPSGVGIVAGVLSKVTANNNHDGIFVGGIAGTGGKVTIVDSEASNNAGSGVVTGSPPFLAPPPTSCCAMSLPATTVPDFSQAGMAFFGSRIRWSRGMVLE